MRCPFCHNQDTRVIDSRAAEEGTAIRRRRSCPACERRFTTQETVLLMVTKRSGATEPFSRSKIIAGVRRACQGRPVTEDALALLGQRVEEEIRSRGVAEVSSHEIGLTILGPLRDLDEVAYLRFASVYRSFESLEDFEREIAELRAERTATQAEPTTGHHSVQQAIEDTQGAAGYGRRTATTLGYTFPPRGAKHDDRDGERLCHA